jgi:hypothetical protein
MGAPAHSDNPSISKLAKCPSVGRDCASCAAAADRELASVVARATRMVTLLSRALGCPKAEVHLYATGHFALETHCQEIAAASRRLLDRSLNSPSTCTARLGPWFVILNWEAQSGRLRSLLPKAVEALWSALDSGSERAAAIVLKAAGLHALQAPRGPKNARVSP